MSGLVTRLLLTTVRHKFPNVQNVSTDTFLKWTSCAKLVGDKHNRETQPQKRKIVILDCRPEIEYNVSHLDGAVRVDFEKDASEILKAAPQLQSSDVSDVVCYCSIGYRASTVVNKLQEYRETTGESDSKLAKNASLYNLEGSLFKWTNEQKPLVDKDGTPTTYTHPFNTVFGKLLNSQHRKFN